MRKIYQELKTRIEQILEVHDDEDDENEFDNNILEVARYRVEKVLMSWGGPSDFFEIWIKDSEIEKISYTTADWGTSETVWLGEGDFDIVASHFDWMTEEV